MWPNARISVMGGEQAAGVLLQINKDSKSKQAIAWTPELEQQFQQPILRQYETEGHPYYSSAR